MLDELIADFQQSEMWYSDNLRMGRKYVFGKKNSLLLPIEKITRIEHYIKSVDGKIEPHIYYIAVYKKRLELLLCEYSDLHNDEVYWNSFCCELSKRNNSITIVTEAKIRHTRTRQSRIN